MPWYEEEMRRMQVQGGGDFGKVLSPRTGKLVPNDMATERAFRIAEQPRFEAGVAGDRMPAGAASRMQKSVPGWQIRPSAEPAGEMTVGGQGQMAAPYGPNGGPYGPMAGDPTAGGRGGLGAAGAARGSIPHASAGAGGGGKSAATMRKVIGENNQFLSGIGRQNGAFAREFLGASDSAQKGMMESIMNTNAGNFKQMANLYFTGNTSGKDLGSKMMAKMGWKGGDPPPAIKDAMTRALKFPQNIGSFNMELSNQVGKPLDTQYYMGKVGLEHNREFAQSATSHLNAGRGEYSIRSGLYENRQLYPHDLPDMYARNPQYAEHINTMYRTSGDYALGPNADTSKINPNQNLGLKVNDDKGFWAAKQHGLDPSSPEGSVYRKEFYEDFFAKNPNYGPPNAYGQYARAYREPHLTADWASRAGPEQFSANSPDGANIISEFRNPATGKYTVYTKGFSPNNEGGAFEGWNRDGTQKPAPWGSDKGFQKYYSDLYSGKTPDPALADKWSPRFDGQTIKVTDPGMSRGEPISPEIDTTKATGLRANLNPISDAQAGTGTNAQKAFYLEQAKAGKIPGLGSKDPMPNAFDSNGLGTADKMPNAFRPNGGSELFNNNVKPQFAGLENGSSGPGSFNPQPASSFETTSKPFKVTFDNLNPINTAEAATRAEAFGKGVPNAGGTVGETPIKYNAAWDKYMQPGSSVAQPNAALQGNQLPTAGGGNGTPPIDGMSNTSPSQTMSSISSPSQLPVSSNFNPSQNMAVHPNLSALSGDTHFQGAMNYMRSISDPAHQNIINGFLNNVATDYSNTHALTNAKGALDNQVANQMANPSKWNPVSGYDSNLMTGRGPTPGLNMHTGGYDFSQIHANPPGIDAWGMRSPGAPSPSPATGPLGSGDIVPSGPYQGSQITSTIGYNGNTFATGEAAKAAGYNPASLPSNVTIDSGSAGANAAGAPGASSPGGTWFSGNAGAQSIADQSIIPGASAWDATGMGSPAAAGSMPQAAAAGSIGADAAPAATGAAAGTDAAGAAGGLAASGGAEAAGAATGAAAGTDAAGAAGGLAASGGAEAAGAATGAVAAGTEAAGAGLAAAGGAEAAGAGLAVAGGAEAAGAGLAAAGTAAAGVGAAGAATAGAGLAAAAGTAAAGTAAVGGAAIGAGAAAAAGGAAAGGGIAAFLPFLFL